MSTTPKISRRAALAAGAALPLAAAVARPSIAIADGHAGTPPNSNKFSFQIGDFEVSTLLVGSRMVEEPQNIFGMNVSSEEFAAAS